MSKNHPIKMFQYHKVEKNVWQIYYREKDIQEHICYVQHKGTAQRITQLLRCVSQHQNIRLWNKETFKEVRRIIRIINRECLYPIPFKFIEKKVGYEIGCYLLVKSHDREIQKYIRYGF